MTNKEYAASIAEFKEACARAKIIPSTRQASKWRQKRGTAWQHRNGHGPDTLEVNFVAGIDSAKENP